MPGEPWLSGKLQETFFTLQVPWVRVELPVVGQLCRPGEGPLTGPKGAGVGPLVYVWYL